MMSSLNWVDYVILGIFLLSIIAGFSRGLVKELVSLITLITAVVVATIFASTLAASFTSSPSVQSAVSDASNSMGQAAGQSVSYVALGLSFGLIFAGTIIVGAILGFFINLAFTAGVLGFGNRLLGAAFGLGRGFFLNLALIFILQLTAVSEQPWWQQSVCIQQYQPVVMWLAAQVSPTLEKLKEKAAETMQNVGGQEQQTQPQQN